MAGQAGYVVVSGAPSTEQRAAARPPASPRSATRQRILRVALELFARRGFDGTDIVDIEARVGLTPGSGGFYRHFRNKQDVLRAAVDAEVERLRVVHASRHDVTDDGDDDEVDLAARVGEALDLLSQMRELIAVVAHDGSKFPDLIPTLIDALPPGALTIDAEALRRLMDAGKIPDRPADVVAGILLMASIGYTFSDVLLGESLGALGSIDRERFGRVLADMVAGQPSR